MEALKRLVQYETLRAAMGGNGVAYVREHYRRDIVPGKYERLFAKIKNAR